MKKLILTSLMLAALPYMALADSPKTAFNMMLRECVREANGDCHDHLTASSTGLYDRFAGYGVKDCIPKDARYISEERDGPYAIIKAGAKSPNSGKDRATRLAFVEEEGQWKLDAPESLRRGLGEKWQQQVEVTEQLYLMLRQQMGGKLNCEAVQALVRK